MTETAPSSLQPTPPDFIPLCPACKYDLSNIPEFKCPECGTPFTLDELRQRWSERHRAVGLPRRPFTLAAHSMAAALLSLGTALLWSWYDVRWHKQTMLLAAAWLFAIAWAARMPRMSWRAWTLRSLWLLVPAFATFAFALEGFGRYRFDNAIWWCVIPGVVACALGFTRTLYAAAWWLCAGTVFGFAVLAALATIDAWLGWLQGLHWSVIPDPRPVTSQRGQYPFTNDEALIVGSVAFCFAILIEAGLVAFARWWQVRHTSSARPSSKGGHGRSEEHKPESR